MPPKPKRHVAAMREAASSGTTSQRERRVFARASGHQQPEATKGDVGWPSIIRGRDLGGAQHTPETRRSAWRAGMRIV